MSHPACVADFIVATEMAGYPIPSPLRHKEASTGWVFALRLALIVLSGGTKFRAMQQHEGPHVTPRSRD